MKAHVRGCGNYGLQWPENTGPCSCVNSDPVLASADRIAAGTSTALPTRSPRTYWTATALLAHDFPEPRWAVPGIICEGVTLLAGQPKVGKSWLALNLAVAVAAGGKALGRTDVEQGPVLYLALEDTARRLASRLRKVLGQDMAPDALAFDTAWPTLTTGGADQLDRWLRDNPAARLVIVDVFARVRGRTESNAPQYELEYGAMTLLKTLADKHKVPFLVVHHTRKAAAEDFTDAVSGTNGLAGAADAVLVLKRMRGSADAELHVTGRDVDEHAYALNFDGAFGTWSMLDGPPTDYTLGDTRQAILRHLRDVQSGTPKQVAAALGLNYNTVKVTCTRMVSDGQLDTDGHGTYLPVTPVTAVTQDEMDGYTGYAGYTLNRDVPDA